jgi:hypothetical protein
MNVSDRHIFGISSSRSTKLDQIEECRTFFKKSVFNDDIKRNKTKVWLLPSGFWRKGRKTEILKNLEMAIASM